MPPEPDKRRRIAAATVLMGMLCSGAGADPTAGWETAKAPASERQARGVIKAMERAVISSRIAGRITRLPFRAGDPFSKGDVLVAVDCALFQARRDKARSELKGARMKLENERRLEALGSAGKLAVALAEARVQETRAELHIASLRVKDCTVAAPYDGRVVRAMTNTHESVQPQEKLLEIVGTGNLETEIIVPGEWLRWLTAGTALTMTIDETGRQVSGEVTAVGATVDPVSHSIIVRARLAGGTTELVPGMSGTIDFAGPGDSLAGSDPRRLATTAGQ